MNDREDMPKPEEPMRKTMCPFCFSALDVHLDVKGRPYWRCWRCEIRSFATHTAFRQLKDQGWIWTHERPAGALKAWLKALRRTLNQAGTTST